jgi:hypothetical protein
MIKIIKILGTRSKYDKVFFILLLTGKMNLKTGLGKMLLIDISKEKGYGS